MTLLSYIPDGPPGQRQPRPGTPRDPGQRARRARPPRPAEPPVKAEAVAATAPQAMDWVTPQPPVDPGAQGELALGLLILILLAATLPFLLGL